MKNFVLGGMKTLRFITYATLKLLTFGLSISMALLKFVIGMVFLILSLGAIGSATTRY